MAEKYAYLLTEYPQTISSNQLYRICHISKRKAKWLLDNGIIPCIDSGKKTRRYTINIHDLIKYLEYVEAHPKESITPIGLFNTPYRSSRRKMLLSADEIELRLRKAWADEPDAFSTEYVAELTGYCTVTVNRWIRAGKLKAIKTSRRSIVAKEWLIPAMVQYLLSDHLKMSPILRMLITEEHSK